MGSISRREFFTTIGGGAVATTAAKVFAGEDLRKSRLKEELKNNSSLATDNLSSTVDHKLTEAAQAGEKVNMMFAAGVGSSLSRIPVNAAHAFLSKYPVVDINAEIAEGRDPAITRIENYLNMRRRGCLNYLAKILSFGALIGPIFPRVFRENLSSAVARKKQQEQNRDLSDQQIADLIVEREEESLNSALRNGGIATTYKAYIDLNRNRRLTNSIKFRYESIQEARNELLQKGKTKIAGFGSILGVYHPYLVDFLPLEFLKDRKEPLNLTVSVDGKSPFQAAYFPDNGGDDTNWSGPGIYFRKGVSNERDTTKMQIKVSTRDFDLEINEWKRLSPVLSDKE